ncbi:HDIG domain-containing protein, partial [Candidatus Woesearchaeota archaeon]|nr:HDIG domain-containing protein [Candidatus Woesearchaeota archaeon]
MNEKQAIQLLKKYSKGNRKVLELVLNHSKAVQKVALELAKDIPDINIDLIKIGSLLHDIGRFDCPPKTELSIRHG